MNSRKLLTVCIPAYNRAALLAPLLDSIVSQAYAGYNILICEDSSPERGAIASVVSLYQAKYPGKISYVENERNLGYDGNIRQLIELSTGQYSVFMGNDDLMCPGALDTIADVVTRVPDCGVMVRTYATFDQDPTVHKQVFRYYPREVVIEPGINAIVAGFRRSVVIPGMVIHRDSAVVLATCQFDGTLLYQIYLAGVILSKRRVVFTPRIIALRRDGTPPDFGNSESEKDKFVPQDQTPDSSICFMRGMLDIAKYIEDFTQLSVFEAIRRDIGFYSYPILSIQAKQPWAVFLRYAWQLSRLGFWRYALFHAYFWALLLMGQSRMDALIKQIKLRLGYTPNFGSSKGRV